MKRNLFKKLAAAAGAAVMALTLVMPMGAVQAAGETINTETPVTLTIEKHVGDLTGLDSSVTGKATTAPGKTIEGVEFTAVKIADIVQESDVLGNNAVKYKLTADAVKVNSEWTVDSVKTGKDLNDWVKTKKAADFGSLDGIGVSAVTGDDGKAIFTSNDATVGTNVAHLEGEQGLYLVVETFAPENITKRSAPFIVSLPMTDKETGNTWMYNVFAYPKNSTADTDVAKEIADINGEQTGINANKTTAEAQIGDVITYHVPVRAIVPDAGLTKLGITDTMSKGLTFVQAGEVASSEDVAVYDGASVNEKQKVPTESYSVKATKEGDSTKLEVNFEDSYLQALNATPGSRQFLFVYKAQLNKDAVLGKTGNTNDVDMIYNYTNNPVDITVPGNTTTVYTWGIDLTKTGDDGSNLVGVEFTLKKADTELSFVYDESISAYRYVVDAEESGSTTLTTQANGKLYIRGLDSGTYTLTETKTNNGYTLLKNPITIVITGNNADGSATATVDGKTVIMEDDVLNTGASTALIPITVVNNSGFDLPQTGAAGTAIFAIAGIVLVAVAGALLIFRRKTQK